MTTNSYTGYIKLEGNKFNLSIDPKYNFFRVDYNPGCAWGDQNSDPSTDLPLKTWLSFDAVGNLLDGWDIPIKLG